MSDKKLKPRVGDRVLVDGMGFYPTVCGLVAYVANGEVMVLLDRARIVDGPKGGGGLAAKMCCGFMISRQGTHSRGEPWSGRWNAVPTCSPAGTN